MVQHAGGALTVWGLIPLIMLIVGVSFIIIIGIFFPSDYGTKQQIYKPSPKQRRLLRKRSMFKKFFNRVSSTDAFQITIKAAELKLKDMERRLTKLPPYEMVAKTALRKQIKILINAINALEDFYVEFIVY